MSENIWVQELFINVTEGYRFGDSDVYETYTDELGRLFKDRQKEYGRCIGKVYVDREDGGVRQIGWVFQKTLAYEDDPKKAYVREVWVTLHSGPPTVPPKQYHYLGQEV